MDTKIGRDKLREFIDLILASLDEQVDGSELASRGFLSRYHFDRLVSAAMGEAPASFRRRILLERAAWELAKPDRSVTSIALAAGYLSPEGFARAFSRTFGRSPTAFRTGEARKYLVPAPNGVHFLPPGALTVPGLSLRSTKMDVVDRLVSHDLWLTQRLLEKSAELSETELDRHVLADNELLFGTHPITLREILESMVSNKENWLSAMSGQPATSGGCTSIPGLTQRLDTGGAAFKKRLTSIRDRGGWDAGFVDALCDPPESFTYGGMLAHVITFAAYRRNLAILALRELGVSDLGIGDPMEWERQR